MIYKSSSPEQTQKIAQKLALKYQKGGVFALIGPLGSGKTTFTQGFAKSLGITQRLISPTFIIMKQYGLPENKKGKFYHLDLYRLDTQVQMEELGIKEIFENPHNIILIEWAEKLGKLLPPKTIKVEFKLLAKNQREIKITAGHADAVAP